MLEAQFPEIVSIQPETLAHHYTQAGFADIAIDYWRKAGERALRRSANVEGVTHLTRAIELIRSLPADRARNRRELDLHLALAQMMRASEGYASSETLRTFARARDLLDDGAAVSERTTVLYGLWSVHYVRALSWELRASTSLARMWRNQGRSEAARELLAPVFGRFTEGFETADLKDAKAVLNGL